MLTFNPYYRATLTECLNHSFLQSVWVPEREDLDVTSLKFEFEFEGDLSESKLRQLLSEQIEYFDELKTREPVY